jgi:hypothetical protein
MPTPFVSITEASYQVLKALAEHTGDSETSVLEKALDAYRRKVFFDQLNQGYAELRTDADAWKEHLTEREQWDATLLDGLDPDQRWTDDGRCPTPADGNQ